MDNLRCHIKKLFQSHKDWNRSKGGENMKDKSCIIYILGAIIGFLAFAFSMKYGEAEPILIIVGMVGMAGMAYCVIKAVNFHK